MSEREYIEIWSYINGLREDLGHAEARISELETRLHDHEQLSPAVSDD
jgi:hypothetical protein